MSASIHRRALLSFSSSFSFLFPFLQTDSPWHQRWKRHVLLFLFHLLPVFSHRWGRRVKHRPDKCKGMGVCVCVCVCVCIEELEVEVGDVELKEVFLRTCGLSADVFQAPVVEGEEPPAGCVWVCVGVCVGGGGGGGGGVDELDLDEGHGYDEG
jgi:hypothetical protein